MASHFHIFRRNQKLMLAILTLLAMFAFVFLDPLFRYMGRNTENVNPVIAETTAGPLHLSDLERLKAQRQLVNNFIEMVSAASIDKMIDQGRLDPRNREQFIKFYADDWKRRIMVRSQATKEGSAVDTLLLARKAEQMNLVVSDGSINQLLKEMSLDSINGAQMSALIHKLHFGNETLSEQQLFDALRTEMEASRVLQNFSASIDALTPAQRWDYYQRLHRKATIEAVAVNVADFADKVPDPSETELKEFFEKHKEQLTFPGSPDPGFKQPRRERFQYFEAEYDLFRETAEVTDQEVSEYYEKNKKTMFRKLSLPASKPDDPNKAEQEPADAAKEEAKDAPKDGGEPKDETKPDAIPDAVPEDKPADEPKTEEKPKPGSAAIERFRQSGVKYLLTADEKPASTVEPKVDQPAAAEPSQETPVDPATEPASETKPDTDPETKSTPSGEPEYEPLEKVKEEIITAIKGQKAREKMDSAISELASRMRNYSDARTYYLVKKDADPNATSPKPLDFVELAKQSKVTYGETQLVSYPELRNSKGLGESFMAVRGEQFQYRAVPFADVAFGDRYQLYTPVTTQNKDGNQFLSWKVEQTLEEVPTFEKVRDEVLKTWKMIKARDLARKQAETYAAEAQAQKKSFSEIFSDEAGPKVIKPGSFSWLTLGTTPDEGRGSVPFLSDVPGIENPGEEFMKTVFSLPLGGTGATMNRPQDICYAVQLIDYEPKTTELETDFANEDFRRYVNVAYGDTIGLRDRWIASVEQEAGLKWLREPRADAE